MNEILQGDALEILKTLPEGSVDCIITSPPYWGLRNYGMADQLGLEKTPQEYVQKIVEVFREARRVLKPKGTFFLNLGDTYSGGGRGGDPKHKKGNNSAEMTTPSYRGLPAKNLVGIPWRVAFALQEDGWILRNEIIWHKKNVMPFPVKDRFTVDFESVFLFVKSKKYFFNQQLEPLADSSIERVKYGWKSKKANASVKGSSQGIQVTEMGNRFANKKGRNKRTVWTTSTSNLRGIHFAPFPEALIEPMILAGVPKNGVVLDPFMGAGTTGVVAKKLGKNYLGIEINPKYIKFAKERIANTQTPLL